MCNPRRVMIHLARHIEESFRRTVEQTVSVETTVDELAAVSVDIRLNEEMGDAALEMLERVLAGEFPEFEPWDRDDSGCLRRKLDSVTLVYDPSSSRLSLETRLTRGLSAQGKGMAEACGFTIGDVAVEAVGRYYGDNWQGRTRERATADARAAAEKKLARAVEMLHQQQHADRLAAAGDRARSAAKTDAAARMDQLRTQARQALREQLEVNLARVEERVFHIMNRAVGEAYRRTLSRAVLESGGRIIRDEKTGSVITMELEV